MPNANYRKGYRMERALVNEYRAKGWLAFRSAGSHSPVDAVLIDPKEKQIFLVQCKSRKMGKTERERLVEQMKDYFGMFDVTFGVKTKG